MRFGTPRLIIPSQNMLMSLSVIDSDDESRSDHLNSSLEKQMDP